jgi:recombination protein RecA
MRIQLYRNGKQDTTGIDHTQTIYRMAKTVKTKEEETSRMQAAMDKLNKSYGIGSVISMGKKETGEYEVISTGSVGVDWVVLGIGGIALGKMYELMGWEGTGKSTLCGTLIANCQKAYPDKKVLCVDSEHATDMNYFRTLGVDIDALILNQPSYGEEGFNVAKDLIETGDVALCIIDSDSGLIPKIVMQADIGEQSKIGKKASLNSTSYPMLKVAANRNKCAVVVVSQYREKIGQLFGDPTTTQGGHCLKFTADVRAQVSKTLIKAPDGELKPGNETKVKTIKNKLFPPYREHKFDILFGKGIDTHKEIVNMAEELGIFQRAGSWYSYGESKVGQGFDAVVQFMADNEDLMDEVRKQVLDKIQEKQ